MEAIIFLLEALPIALGAGRGFTLRAGPAIALPGTPTINMPSGLHYAISLFQGRRESVEMSYCILYLFMSTDDGDFVLIYSFGH